MIWLAIIIWLGLGLIGSVYGRWRLQAPIGAASWLVMTLLGPCNLIGAILAFRGDPWP